MVRAICAVKKKILLLAILSSGCATLANKGDSAISVYSSDKNTKLYLNGRYIGKGSAITYASGQGTDILSGVNSNCIYHVNVKKGLSGFAGLNLLWLAPPLILRLVDEGDTSLMSAMSAVGISFFIADLFSSYSRVVEQKKYDVTPVCEPTNSPD